MKKAKVVLCGKATMFYFRMYVGRNPRPQTFKKHFSTELPSETFAKLLQNALKFPELGIFIAKKPLHRTQNTWQNFCCLDLMQREMECAGDLAQVTRFHRLERLTPR